MSEDSISALPIGHVAFTDNGKYAIYGEFLASQRQGKRQDIDLSIAYDFFLKFVTERHHGQVSMNGEPYIEHLLRVAENVRAILATLPEGFLTTDDHDEALIVALGHDLLEDKRATADDIRAIGGTERLITRLTKLDRSASQQPTYQAWIGELASDDDAVVIIGKLGDNLDNNSDARIAALPEDKRSIRERYDRAYPTLRRGLDDLVARFQRERNYGRATP